jgi:hypothetical protein
MEKNGITIDNKRYKREDKIISYQYRSKAYQHETSFRFSAADRYGFW